MSPTLISLITILIVSVSSVPDLYQVVKPEDVKEFNENGLKGFFEQILKLTEAAQTIHEKMLNQFKTEYDLDKAIYYGKVDSYKKKATSSLKKLKPGVELIDKKSFQIIDHEIANHLHEIRFKLVKAIISLEKMVTDITMELKEKAADPNNSRSWTVFLKLTLDEDDFSYLTKEAVNEIKIVIDSLV